MTLRSCPRGPWSVQGASLVIGVWPAMEIHRIAPLPAGLSELYNEIFDASGLHCRPQLAWIADAGGRLGFYAHGLVALGAKDMTDLATNVWTKYLTHLSVHDAYWAQLSGECVYTLSFEQVWWICVRLLLAHELGHARQAECGDGRHGIAAETDADDFAARIAQVLGWDASLDALVMHAIGCTSGTACGHPSPDGRVAVYRRAREAERRAQLTVAHWR